MNQCCFKLSLQERKLHKIYRLRLLRHPQPQADILCDSPLARKGRSQAITLRRDGIEWGMSDHKDDAAYNALVYHGPALLDDAAFGV